MSLKYTIKDGKLYEIVNGEAILKGTPDKNVLSFLKDEYYKAREERGIEGNDNPKPITELKDAIILESEEKVSLEDTTGFGSYGKSLPKKKKVSKKKKSERVDDKNERIVSG